MRVQAVFLALCLSTATLAGCGHGEGSGLTAARADNVGRHVSSTFESTPQVLADADDSGVDAVRRFFDASDTVVIAGPTQEDALRAASIAVVAHAPMLTLSPGNRDAVMAEVARLGARIVLAVGEINLADATGELTVMRDPGTYVALGEMTALSFEPHPIDNQRRVIAGVAGLDPNRPRYLYPGWTGTTPPDTSDWSSAQGRGHKKAAAFPAQSKRDAAMAPVVIASEASSIASVASARAFGAEVRVMPVADPGASPEALAMVAGLADSPLIALGAEFGTGESLREQIRRAEAQSG